MNPIGGPSYPGSPRQAIRWLPFKNNSGETAPAWAIMQVSGAETGNGQQRLTVIKPDGTGKVFAINGNSDVAASGIGSCTLDYPAYVLYDSGTGTPTNGDTWGPKSGQWKLAKNAGEHIVIGGNLGSGATSRTLVYAGHVPGYWYGDLQTDVTSTGTLPFVENLTSPFPCFTNSSGTLTCLRGGVYRVGYSAFLNIAINATGANSDAAYITVKKNGSDYNDSTAQWLESSLWADVNVNVMNTGYITITKTVMIELEAGDTMLVYCTLAGGRTKTITAGAGPAASAGTVLAIDRVG